MLVWLDGVARMTGGNSPIKRRKIPNKNRRGRVRRRMQNGPFDDEARVLADERARMVLRDSFAIT